MFVGSYNHTLDEKGRLIIPAKFREKLGEECMVTQGLDGCLFVFDMNEWERFAEKLRALPMIDADSRKFARYFLAGAAALEVNKSGRILIPETLRKAAGITQDVVLIGVGARIEIWSREHYEKAVTYDDMDEIASRMAAIGIGF